MRFSPKFITRFKQRGGRAAERRYIVSEHRRSSGELDELVEVASKPTPEIVRRALAAAREELGMDVAFVSEFTEDRMVFRKLVGDAESFGLREGECMPLDDTLCWLLLSKDLPT
jgi:hypothetical protein